MYKCWLFCVWNYFVVVVVATEDSVIAQFSNVTRIVHDTTNDCYSVRGSRNPSALERVRQLQIPRVLSTTQGDTENLEFWTEHGSLLREAWNEWGKDREVQVMTLDNMVNQHLVKKVMDAWNHHQSPQNDKFSFTEIEKRIQSLWESTAHPDVYSMDSFLTNEGVIWLRKQLENISNAGIPLRRPNAMNRYGFILSSDDEIDGAVQVPFLDQFLTLLVDVYMRPICRLLYKDLVGKNKDDDIEHYAFTISYRSNQDIELKEHRDASLFTMNINLNLEEDDKETFSGSSLYFVDEQQKQRFLKPFSQGMAILHPGSVRHAALPIQDGTRHNLVIWIFGKYGDVRIAPYDKHEQMAPEERWTLPFSNAHFPPKY